MSDELELASLAAASAVATENVAPKVEGQLAACRNCGAEIHRKYCGQCGQLAQSFHRPILSLVSELLGDFFSLDGRVARTVPALLVNPGSVTRSYLDGKRQRFVPPFRLYLLSSFIFFLIFFSFGQSHGWFQFRFDPEAGNAAVSDETNSPVDVQVEVRKALAENDIEVPKGALEFAEAGGENAEPPGAGQALDEELSDAAPDASIDLDKLIVSGGKVDRDYLNSSIDDMVEGGDQTGGGLKELANIGADIYENQSLFFSALRNNAPRFALALTPALVLCFLLVFPFRKGIYLYDHVIAALHFQTWAYLLCTFAVLLGWAGLEASWVMLILFLAPPVYMYRFFRKVYRSGRFLGVLRTGTVLMMLTIIGSIWLVAVFAQAANETAELSRATLQN